MKGVASSGFNESIQEVLQEGFRELLRDSGLPPLELRQRLEGISNLPLPRAITEGGVGIAGGSLDGIEEALDGEYRRERGAHMTPRSAAMAMLATLVDRDIPDGAVGDISCGHGELLLALRRRFPERQLIGVEWRQELAIASAMRLLRDDLLAEKKGEPPRGAIRIFCGDGLEDGASWIPEEGFAVLLGNPPYVPEKGRKEFFRGLQSAHSHLVDCFGPRMDLLYLFLVRCAQITRPGGWNVWLTPPYWLTATGAAPTRRLLLRDMVPREFLLLEERDLFKVMPGTEHLISTFASGKAEGEVEDFRVWRGSLEALGAEAGEIRKRSGQLMEAGWFPFATADALSWKIAVEKRGSKLSDLANDLQGFVSGADRVTRRNQGLLPEARPGEPIFLWERGAMPVSWKDAPPGLIRPVLRGREVMRDRVFRRCPGSCRVLYIDDEAFSSCTDEIMEELLGRFRPVLEKRREVQDRRMPWARLHWPRDRGAMEGPKLVVPRRAPAPCFALDLSGAMISSDCTFLTAPASVRDPIRYLAGLMLLLNDEGTARYLRHFGKRKGAQIEFYSEPLRRIPLPARLHDGELRVDPEQFGPAKEQALWERVERLLSETQEG